MKTTIEGIVLNETNYGETSKILNVLTKEYGYISIISKGSRKIKSKLRGISMTLVLANFTINYKPKGISTLIEGNPINSLKNIFTDFSKMNYAMYLVKLSKSVLKDTFNNSLYDILKNALIKINEGFNPLLITNIVEIKYLSFLGVEPNFTNCYNCLETDIITFDLKNGGVVCKNCYNDTYIFNKNTLKLLKLFQTIDISKIDKLNISNELVVKEIQDFIKEYYETYTGIYLIDKNKLINLMNIT